MHCEYVSAVIDVVNILHYVYVMSFMGAGLHIGARTQVVRGYQHISNLAVIKKV